MVSSFLYEKLKNDAHHYITQGTPGYPGYSYILVHSPSLHPPFIP